MQEKAQHAIELQKIAQIIRKLLLKIEDAVPLINLAITASGASLSSSLPPTVSPSRLLQASTFLTAGDSQYVNSTNGYMQIGPTFVLSMYMLFSGHIRAQDEDDVRMSTWKEAIHKAVVRLMRVPFGSLYELPGSTRSSEHQNTSIPSRLNSNNLMSSGVRAEEFAYQLVIVEDLEDDRVHSFDDDEPQPEPYEDVNVAGIRELVPIHEVSKIFYADTGKILNIGSEGEANSPVLLLKRDPHAVPPRRMMDTNHEFEDVEKPSEMTSSPASTMDPSNWSSSVTSDHPHQETARIKEPWRLPSSLDPEWIAFEVYKEADDSDTEAEDDRIISPKSEQIPTSSLSSTTSALSRLHMNAAKSASPSPSPKVQTPYTPSLPAVRTSLSLLEMLIRLLSLQQFQQTPHLSIPDELLTFFLSESASTGAASNDAQERRRLREDARRRVGFDPYDESPVKRRGEEYLHNSAEMGDSAPWNAEGGQEFTDERYGTPIGPVRYDDPQHDDEGYNTRNISMPPQSDSGPYTPRRFATDSPADRPLKNRQPRETTAAFSDGSTRSKVGRPTPLSRRSEDGRYGLRSLSSTEQERKGSPLARADNRLVDEALKTSPNVRR